MLDSYEIFRQNFFPPRNCRFEYRSSDNRVMSAVSMAGISAGQQRIWDFLRVIPSASIRISSDASVVYRIFYSVCKGTFFCGGNSPWSEPDQLISSNEEINEE